MSEASAQLAAAVREELLADRDALLAPPDRDRLRAAIRRRGAGLGGGAILELLSSVEAELIGAGPLAGLLTDPTVSDVLVNGPGDVWVDRGQGSVRVPITFADDGEVRRLAVRLAAAAGRRLDTGVPFVDAQLPGGVRLHAVLPPIAVGGVCLSLRIHRDKGLDLAALIRGGTLTEPLAEVLEAMVRSRLAFVVTGGAGSGKTTLLAALLARADPGERLVVVEDAAELAIDHPHVVRLQARTSNVEGAGEVTLRDLVRQALRMRPDRLIVGEVRGAELLDMLLAANTGHEGGVSTLHANGVRDVPARIEALAMLAGVGRMAAHSLLASALCAAVHVKRDRSGKRRVTEIAVLARDAGSGFVVAYSALQHLDASRGAAPGPGAGALRALIEQRGASVPSALRNS